MGEYLLFGGGGKEGELLVSFEELPAVVEEFYLSAFEDCF